MNQQPAEKVSRTEDGRLQIHSMFRTIQGEGPFTGRRAIFVRLAGCNLQCPMCDTDYTSRRWERTCLQVVEEALYMVNEESSGWLVVITGGEPFRQNIRGLVLGLLEAGFDVQIETNGTLYQDLPYDRITVVCSPKTGTINQQLLPHIAALKYVVAAHHVLDDGLPEDALSHPANPHLARPPENFKGIVYIQPMDEGVASYNQPHIDQAIESVLSHGYVLCLQTHKMLGLE